MNDQVEDVVDQAPVAQNSDADTPAPTAAETPVSVTQPVASTSEPTAKDAPATAEKVDPSPSEKEPEPEPVATASLEVVIFDDKNQPIPKMALRVIDVLQTNLRKKVLFDGATDPNGRVPVIENLPIGTRFEIQIRRDTGEYKFSACGTLDVAAEHTANLLIPRQRFEFSTSSHQGAPGLAEDKVKDLVKKHNQAPEEKPDISRNPPEKKPEIIVDRNKDGNPVVIVKDGQKNMMGTNAAKVPFTNVGKQADVEKVKALIEFAMEQIKWKHPGSKTTDIILREMRAGSYSKTMREKGDGKGYLQSLKACNKYVKVALGFNNFGGEDGPAPAHKMGPALEAAGFKNITKDLPDARWAAPGDVIVYLDKTDPEKAGHIDIRTYDGYVSDFWESYLPVSGYIVTGIYRKYYDPLPEKRMRAFLKMIRSREASTLFLASGDEAAYRAMPNPGIKGKEPPTFESFEKHPFADKSAVITAAGAYGITYETWKLYVVAPRTSKPWVVLKKGEAEFSPTVQDRIAIAIMDLHPGQGWGDAEYQTKLPTSLALVRIGRVEEAAKQLATTKPRHPAPWTSLPSGKESRQYTTEQMLADYEKFYAELK